MEVFGYRFVKFDDVELIAPNTIVADKSVLPCKSSVTIKQNSSVIGNYAKSNNVKIRFFDPRRKPQIMQPLAPGVELGGCVGIEVTSNNPGSAVKYGLVNLFEHEDKTPFITKLYNKLAEVVEGKGNPFAIQKNETILKLIQEGKIRA